MQDSWQRLMSDSISWQKTLKNSHKLQSQWHVVSIRYNEMINHLTPKVGFEGTPKLGPYWKSQPGTYNVNKDGVDIRIESVNKDNSHSWVRIQHGLNKLVTDLRIKEDDDNEQETSEMQFDDFSLTTNVFAFSCPSRAKAKPQRRTPASSSTRTVPIGERKWIDIEPENYSPIACPVWKRLSTLLRQCHLLRDDDVAIEFYLYSGLMTCGSTMAKGGGNMKRFQYWTDPSGQEINSLSPSSSRSFRTQSHWSFITGQSFNSKQFLRVHLSHRMCDQFTLHHEFRIDTRRTKNLEKTDGILHVCGSFEQRKQRSGCNLPGSTASCLVPSEEAEETSKHGVLGRHQTCSKERIEVLSDAIERSHPLRHAPSLLYPESYYDGNWRNHIRESICVNSTSSEDFLYRQWNDRIGSILFECSGNRQTCLTWLRKHQCENMETCFQLCASVCWTFR